MSHWAKSLFHCFSSGINLFITWPLRTMHFFWDEFVMSDAFQSCASLVIFGANCSQPLKKRAMMAKVMQNSWPFYSSRLFSSTGIKPGLRDERSLFCALIFHHHSMSRSWRWNELCLIILFTFQVMDSLGICRSFTDLPRRSFAAIYLPVTCIHLLENKDIKQGRKAECSTWISFRTALL
jgi:hypothetical protein